MVSSGSYHIVLMVTNCFCHESRRRLGIWTSEKWWADKILGTLENRLHEFFMMKQNGQKHDIMVWIKTAPQHPLMYEKLGCQWVSWRQKHTVIGLWGNFINGLFNWWLHNWIDNKWDQLGEERVTNGMSLKRTYFSETPLLWLSLLPRQHKVNNISVPNVLNSLSFIKTELQPNPE